MICDQDTVISAIVKLFMSHKRKKYWEVNQIITVLKSALEMIYIFFLFALQQEPHDIKVFKKNF